MNPAHVASHLLITGRSGTGKTTLWLDMLCRWRGVRFVFDPGGLVAHRLAAPSARDAADVANHVCIGWVLYDPSRMFPGRRAEGFDWFCRGVFQFSERTNGPKVLACDELQSVISHRRPLPYWFARCLDEGRSNELDTCCITNAINRTHEGHRNQVTRIVCFNVTGNKQLSWLDEWADIEKEKVSNLARGQFITADL